jgi:Zn-dependent M28 family amino/carboxypeptidase
MGERKMKKVFIIISTVLVLSTVSTDTVNSSIKNKVSKLISEVDSDFLLDTLIYLTSFNSRSSYEVQEEVVEFIGNELEKAGAKIRLHEYEYNGRTWHNLVATVPGNASLEPSEPHLVVGAHIDSISVSPGADDNASGVSAVMEAARVLASSELTMRVDFVFFTLEELGRIGSRNYAADARTSGERIEAMINVDMIAFGPTDEDLDLVTKPSMAWIAEDFNEAVDTYTNLYTTLVIDETCG